MTPRLINWSGIVLCSALLLPLAGAAGQQGAAVAVSNEAANRDQAGGIKVHGRWTITVSNADGSVASRHEFNNALTPSGATILGMLVGHSPFDLPEKWQVKLRSRSGQDNPCGSSTGSPVSCLIWEASQVGLTGDAAHVSNLRVGLSAVGSSSFVLQGSIKTAFAGAIDDVSTALMLRDPRGDILTTLFTQHFLSTPVVVQAGQTIDVKVVINLS
jgi:hypothetical protein